MSVRPGLIGDQAVWHDDTHTFTFPSGATVDVRVPRHQPTP